MFNLWLKKLELSEKNGNLKMKKLF